MPAYPPKYGHPITPPIDYGYNYNGCGAQLYLPPSFAGQPGLGMREDAGYGYAERYDQSRLPSVTSTLMYSHQQNAAFQSNALPAPQAYYNPAHAAPLPAMQLHQQRSMGNIAMRQRSQEFGHMVSQAKEEKPTGGVSAKLDYDMDVMTDFVCDMAHGIVQTGRPMPTDFKKWANGVLVATRLPAATIALGLHYLSLRMQQMANDTQERLASREDGALQRFLTLGLLLGSKFLDDNTFINRSWSEVSGFKVQELNKMEQNWLAAFEFRLHRDPNEPQGFASWMDHWKDYEKQAIARKDRLNKLAPLDTSVPQYLGMKSFSSVSSYGGFNRQLPTPEYSYKPMQTQFNTPIYSQYDCWSARPALDYSPASSAPITGPTTPEYYVNSSTWVAPEPYTRRSMFGFPPAAQPSAQQVTQPHQSTLNFGAAPFTPQQNVNPWNGHSGACTCAQCPRLHTGLGPQTAFVH